ncbi:MAG: C39 family peptidase [Planctomycetota bacterium]
MRFFLGIVIIGVVSGVSLSASKEAPKPAPSSGPKATETTPSKVIPHVRQKPDFCGEACVEMVLRRLGSKLTQDEVFALSGLDPSLGRGCYTADLNRALDRLGFRVGTVFHRVAVKKADEELRALWAGVRRDLDRGVPSIVCTRFDKSPNTTEHFRLVVGFDPKSSEVIYHDPAFDKGANRRMKLTDFFELWPLKYERDRWTVIRFALDAPDQAKLKKATAEIRREWHSPADFAQHVMKLKKRLGKRFTVLVEKPFVVIGDQSPSEVKRWSKRTVRWATDRLKELYFDRDPREILDVYLFRDKKSYRYHTKKFFNDNPGTPYGYYSPTHKALIMDISTGGGTLVHEIVHPFVEANFPRCPSWFNEGLGSLYEQSGERGGRIRGLVNWRLRGLQNAIRAGTVPSFQTLTATTTREFYDEDPGSNYGQARYLCYYLQEKGLLTKYYKRFVARREKDPTGYQTLKEVLGVKDMKAFQKKWEAFVLKLRF